MIFNKISKDLLSKCKDRYPILYLEHGRINIDDSSVMWIDASSNVVALPISTIQLILLGPGTSITQEALKTIALANTHICVVSDQAFRVISSTITPTSDSRHIIKQASLSLNSDSRVLLAKKLFSKRLSDCLDGLSIQEMMGKEGVRVKASYKTIASKYNIQWRGRVYRVGEFYQSDKPNKYLTLFNSCLYGLCTSVIISLGYSPLFGFIHQGSPLPFTYDIADLYKEFHCIDLAFLLASSNKDYTRSELIREFSMRCASANLLDTIQADITSLFQEYY